MQPNQPDTAILITSDGMGRSTDPALPGVLIAKYLQLLAEHDYLPGAICFYTDGVKLVIDNSPVLDTLKTLEARGVQLIICSTCLNTYGLQDRVGIGIVGGMTDIIEAQWRADKVITL